MERVKTKPRVRFDAHSSGTLYERCYDREMQINNDGDHNLRRFVLSAPAAVVVVVVCYSRDTVRSIVFPSAVRTGFTQSTEWNVNYFKRECFYTEKQKINEITRALRRRYNALRYETCETNVYYYFTKKKKKMNISIDKYQMYGCRSTIATKRMHVKP